MGKISREKFKVYQNVFDNFTLRELFKLGSQGYFDDLVSPVMIGKESNVFLAEKDDEHVIVKIYRLETCNFNKMYSYIRADPRFMNLKNQRRLIIFKWVQREYRNLMIAREKIYVPTPQHFSKNILIMESIGGNVPAPQLKDKIPKDLPSFAQTVLKFVRQLAGLGLVHADLSEFNILNHNEKPYFIDFSQATSIKDPNALEYLERDINNLKRFFAKYDYHIDAEKEIELVKQNK